ncbi:hypothetical protein PC116_g25731 [Phytophthora cactorum]|nr:hypothetical protein Pcac1_g19819 [Phytophthora cactorum]KAG4225853.1 hypothetical protein PC116_g25731 [Phytophthora cactorum]
MFTNRQVATFYFQQVLDAQDEPVVGYFRSRCSCVRQQAPRNGVQQPHFARPKPAPRLRRSHALCSTRGDGYARAVDPPVQFESVWMVALDGNVRPVAARL